MAKFILFPLTLALVAATIAEHRGAFSAAATDDGDLAQRRETMAEAVRVFSNPKLAAAADSETVWQMASFMKREIGPLGPIFDAIHNMPESSPTDVRAKDEAFDAALGLLISHFRKLMPPGSGSCAKAHDL